MSDIPTNSKKFMFRLISAINIKYQETAICLNYLSNKQTP